MNSAIHFSSEMEHEKPQADRTNPARRFGAFTDYIIGFPTQSGKVVN